LLERLITPAPQTPRLVPNEPPVQRRDPSPTKGCGYPPAAARADAVKPKPLHARIFAPHLWQYRVVEPAAKLWGDAPGVLRGDVQGVLMSVVGPDGCCEAGVDVELLG
jgi:hypothetical protein